jgi:hypothetical protein
MKAIRIELVFDEGDEVQVEAAVKALVDLETDTAPLAAAIYHKIELPEWAKSDLVQACFAPANILPTEEPAIKATKGTLGFVRPGGL